MSPAVVRSVDVAVDPPTAFRIFTEEIGEWYRGGRYSWNVPEQALGIEFVPGVGGSLRELHRDGGSYEMGRVLVWEPGRRLVFRYSNVHLPPDPPTEVEVRFEPVAEGTRVTLEHRGLERMPPAIAASWEERAWKTFMAWFAEHVGRA